MERTDKLAGNWRAIVTDNVDPLKSGRVLIDIPSIRLRNLWAEPAIQVGGSLAHGSYIIPRVNDKLFVFFDGGNISHPIYFAMSPSQNDIPVAFNESDPLILDRNKNTIKIPNQWNEPQTNSTVEYPYCQGVKFPGGVLLVVDESNSVSKVAMYHPSSSYEEWQGDGKHVSRVSSDDFEIIMNDQFVYIGGSLSKYVADTLTLTVGKDYNTVVGGSGKETYIANSTKMVGGNLTSEVVGNAGIKAAGISAIFGGGDMLADSSGFNMVITSLVKIAATAIQLSANTEISIIAPLVKLGMAGSTPVHVLGSSFCPYIGAPVSGGSTTVFGTP